MSCRWRSDIFCFEMLKLIHKVEAGKPTESLTLPYESRTRSRLKVSLDDGGEAGLFLPRGSMLNDGDLLVSEDGVVVEVKAALEAVSTARSDDPLMLARACYHLGNRHVLLQIEPGLLRYQHDHVLDDMVSGLGLTVSLEEAPFEPEPGAYGDYGHAGGHEHDHTPHQLHRHG